MNSFPAVTVCSDLQYTSRWIARHIFPGLLDCVISAPLRQRISPMTAYGKRPTRKNWIRFALKLGLLATDATVLSAIRGMLTERDVPDEGGRSRRRPSQDTSDPRGWSRGSALLVGASIGFGMGILFAPVSGEQARTAIRERAMDVRDRVSDAAAWATRSASSVGSRRSTGTYGE